MAVKTNGATWNKFYSDETVWGPGPKPGHDDDVSMDRRWHDEEEISVDGVLLESGAELTEIPDAAIVTIAGGFVYDGDEEIGSLESVFRKWKKRQEAAVLVVEAPSHLKEAVSAAILCAGGKIVLRG